MDWSVLIRGIQEKGFSQAEIAGFCGCEQPQISLLMHNKRGKSLSFEVGNRLLEMKKQVDCGEIKKG